MGFTGPRFTWSRGIDTETFEGARLDRALCNMAWRLLFDSASVHHIPKLKSVHTPILTKLQENKHSEPKAPFRFQAAWLKNKELQDVIHLHWNNELK